MALARLLTQVERGGAPARMVGRVVGPLVDPIDGPTFTIGITGAPGAGKSTLTSRLVASLRDADHRVAVLAIDPSSPHSGGAILGDRVRMDEHTLDESVFIRSMATRGHLGGLTLAVPEALRVLEATGHDRIIVETVGVGQVEIEVADAADCTVVVVNPGWGDAVQANKAGLMEIADVLVVNKADRPGTRDTVQDLERMQMLRPTVGSATWTPPIVVTTATTGEGVSDLVDAIERHRVWSDRTGELARRRAERSETEMRRIVTQRISQRVTQVTGGTGWPELVTAVREGRRDPWDAVDEALQRAGLMGPG